MKNIETIINQPIFFERNRVFRVYTGGMPYKNYFNDPNGYDDGTDNFFPEEWVASTVKALNKKSFGKRDGVSVIENTEIFFDDLVNDYPQQLLGNKKFDCLIKFLDSAIRLPFQAHPTKEFSRKHFNSNYGKTESWLVLATRPGAKIHFGFKDKMTKEQLAKMEEQSETEKHIFDDVLFSVDAKVGDVFLIRAGLVHAIGKGCTILEVQEPTDFTVQPERWCGDYHLNHSEEFLTLDKDTGLDVFDYSVYGKAAADSAKITPRIDVEKDGYKKETLIGYDDTPCFAEIKHTLSNASFTLENAPAVYICIDGNGQIIGENYCREIKRGSYFFLPHCAKGKFNVSGSLTLIECLPSKQDD